MSADDDPPSPDPFPAVTAVVLAAGQGQRLRSPLPKPVHPICGRAMAAHILHALAAAGLRRAVVVIPPAERGALIQHTLNVDAPNLDLRYAVQTQPNGTADALLAAAPQVRTEHVLVVNGDLPLLTADQIHPLLCAPPARAVLATAFVAEPARMGRIKRDAEGSLEGIIEYRDATAAERELNEVNLGLYRFQAEFLWQTLKEIIQRSASGEAYATDAIPAAVQQQSARAVPIPLPDGRLNVETPADAAAAEAVIRQRLIAKHLTNGVHIRDRNAVWIDAQAVIDAGAILEPGVHIRGKSKIGAGARIGPNAIVETAQIGADCELESCTVKESVLREGVEVGPYSTIRPGCELGARVHIGTHAELKAALIGADAQIGHFSYVGDAAVGARTNIGAGAITCNFDGTAKHRTVIGEDAFIGCDTMLIAPVHIGDRARTGAGAVVNKDVPADANAVGHPARLTPSRRRREADA